MLVKIRRFQEQRKQKETSEIPKQVTGQKKWEVMPSLSGLCSQTAQRREIFALACFPFKTVFTQSGGQEQLEYLQGVERNKNIVIVLP